LIRTTCPWQPTQIDEDVACAASIQITNAGNNVADGVGEDLFKHLGSDGRWWWGDGRGAWLQGALEASRQIPCGLAQGRLGLGLEHVVG